MQIIEGEMYRNTTLRFMERKNGEKLSPSVNKAAKKEKVTYVPGNPSPAVLPV